MLILIVTDTKQEAEQAISNLDHFDSDQELVKRSKTEIETSDGKRVVAKPAPTAMKGIHADVVWVKADNLTDEEYMREVKTRAGAKQGVILNGMS